MSTLPMCPLCLSNEPQVFWEHKDHLNWNQYSLPEARRPKTLFFYCCSECGLVFKDPIVFTAVEMGRSQYDLHKNEAADPRYREFLARLSQPLSERIGKGDSGLDYGCGQSHALESIFKETGFECESYDPLFHPREDLLQKRYDFIACSEVAEHFTDPNTEFGKLRKLLRAGGWLGLMTSFVPEDRPFGAWHYHLDPTHVVFYSRRTMAWIAKRFGFDRCETEKETLAFLRAST